MADGELIQRIYDFVNGQKVEEYHLDNEFNRIHEWVNGKLGNRNIAADANIEGTKLKDDSIPYTKLDAAAKTEIDTKIANAGLGVAPDRSVEGIKLKEKAVGEAELFAVTTAGGSEPEALAKTNDKGEVGKAIKVSEPFAKVFEVDVDKVCGYTTASPIRTNAIVGQMGGQPFTLGGTDGANYQKEFKVLDEATRAFVAKAVPPVYMREGVAIEYNNKLYVFPYVTGTSSTTVNTSNMGTIYVYDIATDTWLANIVSSAPAALSITTYGKLLPDNTFLLVTLGNAGASTTWIYNPSANTWAVKTPCPVANKQGARAIPVDEWRTVFIGGQTTGYLPTLEYNAQTDVWTTKAPMPAPTNVTWQRTVFAVYDRVAIGFPVNGTYAYGRGIVYHIDNDEWSYAELLATERIVSLTSNYQYVEGRNNDSFLLYPHDISHYIGHTAIAGTVVLAFGFTPVTYVPDRYTTLTLRRGAGDVSLLNVSSGQVGSTVVAAPGDKIALLHGFRSYKGKVEIIASA